MKNEPKDWNPIYDSILLRFPPWSLYSFQPFSLTTFWRPSWCLAKPQTVSRCEQWVAPCMTGVVGSLAEGDLSSQPTGLCACAPKSGVLGNECFFIHMLGYVRSMSELLGQHKWIQKQIGLVCDVHDVECFHVWKRLQPFGVFKRGHVVRAYDNTCLPPVFHSQSKYELLPHELLRVSATSLVSAPENGP